MATKSKIIYEAQERDLKELARRGAEEGARFVLEKCPVELEGILLLGRLKAGLITIEDLCKIYGVSRQTVYNWEIEPIEYPGQQNLYRVSEIEDQLSD